MTEPLRLEKRVFWRTVQIQHNIVKASKSVLDLLRSLSLSLHHHPDVSWIFRNSALSVRTSHQIAGTHLKQRRLNICVIYFLRMIPTNWSSIWHIFWHCIWHSISRIVWHSFRHSLWHSIWHLALAVEVRQCPQRSGARGWGAHDEERRVGGMQLW